MSEGERLAEWSTEYINDLPDSAFLFIEEGGEKDDEGKTTPRSLRHLPYKNHLGEIDLPHLRNAIARAGQITLKDGSEISDEKAQELKDKAREILKRETGESMSEDELSKNIESQSNLDEGKGEKDVLSESLSVLSEVREELSNLYTKYDEVSKEKEQLSEKVSGFGEENKKLKEELSELQEYRKQSEQLSERISKFEEENQKLKEELSELKSREEESRKQARMEKLQKISNNYRKLGQERSVEELNQLPDNTLLEIEKLTDKALEKINEESLDVATVPTQGMGKSGGKSKESMSKETEKEFGEQICEFLSQKQQ